MKNNKSINIYMGIIGEAYVDKETAYAVLLAAKKNILDVQAIIEAAHALERPLTKARFAAQQAITSSVDVYTKLKNAIAQFDESDLKFAKLYALLSDLNENDFDDNFSNGGNIFTARENLTFAESLDSEIHEILTLARDLLDANKLNAVVRCKEYNIAKEMFEAMIPEKIISPEDISDSMEAELLRRINEVRNNIDYVNLVSDEIINISKEVSDKIEKITSGKDENVKPQNETLYWYAGNIRPYDNESFLTELGFTWDDTLGTFLYRKVTYEDGNIKSVEDLDFGIDGPLRANKWFHQPLHLIQDGQLIAGVDGGKAKYSYWYVAVPRYIPTAAGSTAYATSEAKKEGKSINEWAAENAGNTELVDTLYPCKPRDYEHIDDAHGHPILSNEWMDRNHNDFRDENADDNNWGYKKITTPDSALSINGILYDVWETPVTMYNKQRLNVYFNFGKPETKETIKGLYWYIGKNKPTYNSDQLNEEGWMKITNQPTAEAPLTYDAILDSKIFYIAIPKGFGIFSEEGVDLTDPELEAESPYTLVYTTLIGSNTYNVFITGNEDAKFNDKVYAQEGTNIDIKPDDTPGSGGSQGGDGPQDDEPGLDPSLLSGNYWYAGPDMVTPSTNPESGKIYAMNSTHIGWHNIDGDNPTSIATGEIVSENKINWVLAIPAKFGLNRISNGEDVTDAYSVSHVVANGVEYIVFVQLSQSKKTDRVFVSNGGNVPPQEPTEPQEPTKPEQTHYYWYAGIGPVNESSTPGSDNNWHLIDGVPTSIVTGEQTSTEKIAWYIAVPTALGLNHISNGEDITDAYDATTVTCADGVEYKVFTQISASKKLDITIVQ